jgi:hypothetical protein
MATFSGLPVELKFRIVKHINAHDAAYKAQFANSPIVAPKNIEYKL